MRRPLCSLLALGLLAAAGPVRASGFMISKMGGDLAGPTEPNAAAVFWNPAAIGPVDGASLMLDFNLAWRSLDYTRSWEAVAAGGRPDSPGTMRTFAVLPMVGFTVKPRLPWLTVGIAMYVPFGHRSDWPAYDLEAERARPEAERRPIPPQAFHTLTGGIEIFYTTPSLAICPFYGLGLDWLWLGLNASWVRAEIDSSRIKDLSADINELVGFELAGPEQMAYSGTTELDFAGDGFAFAFGIYAQPWSWLRLGLSWTSGSKLVLPGTMRLYLPELVAGALDSGSLVKSRAELHMDLPPALRFGVHWDISDWLVFRLNLEYVHWELFRDIRIHELSLADEQGPVAGLEQMDEYIDPRRYRNAVDVRAGFRFYVRPWWMLYAGAGYDTSAVPAATTTPDLYDGAKLGLAGGSWVQIIPLLEWLFDAELDRDDRIGLGLGVTWVHYLDRTISGSATEPPINGDYRSEVVLLNTNLEARF